MKKGLLKKVSVSICVLQLAALLFAAPQSAATILRDGTFETVEPGGALPSYWSANGVKVQAEEVHTGLRALVFTPGISAATLRQYTASGAPVPGESFTVSFWVKRAENTVLSLRYAFINEKNATIPGTTCSETIETVVGQWERVTRICTVHENAKRMDFMLTVEGGTAYVDDIYCMPTSESIQKDDTPHMIYGNTGENPLGMLSCNMDFETVANTVGSNMWPDIAARRTDSISHGGNWSYHVTSTGDVTLGTTVTRNKLVGGATYQVVLWLNVVSSGGTIQLKPEFYKDMTSQSNWAENVSAYTAEYARNLEPMGSLTYGGWRRVVRTFETPPDAKSLRLFVRSFGAADFYVDDISVTQIAPPFYGRLQTDAGVYYPDLSVGKAIFWVNTASYPALENAAVNFCLRAPDGSVLYTGENISQNTEDKAVFTFPVSLLTMRKTAYTVEAEIPGASVETKKIYCYERPTMLSADGTCTAEGKTFRPLFAYHVKPENYKKVAAEGVSVVQAYASGGHATALKAAEEAGIKVLLVLYSGMKPAGHPDNIESTRKTVETYKDHPALFGYAVMDEPTVYFQDPSDYLMASYKAIRDLDDVHPVWIVEGSAANNEYSTELCSGYCDIFAIDHYVADTQNAVEEQKTTRRVSKARDAIAPGRPLYALLEGGGVNSDNEAESIRNQGWQAFLGGANAIGYYMNGNNVNVGGLLDAIGAFYRTDYKTAQRADSLQFTAQGDGDVLYRRWMENGKTYTLALNRKNAEGSAVKITASGITAHLATTLRPLEVRLCEGNTGDLFASSVCTVEGAENVRLLAGIYIKEEKAAELLQFAVGEGTVSLLVPQNEGIFLTAMTWDDGIHPMGKMLSIRIR